MEKKDDADNQVDWSLRSLAEKEFPVNSHPKITSETPQNYEIELPQRRSVTESEIIGDLESSSFSQQKENLVEKQFIHKQTAFENKDHPSYPREPVQTKIEHFRENKSQAKLPRLPPPRNPPLPPIDDEFKLSPLTTAAEVLATDDFKKLEQLIGLYKRLPDNN